LNPGAPVQARSRVLLADDTPDIREVLRTYLGGCRDFEVIGEASDGRQAVALAAEERPDLIVLDLSMPEMDGLEALRAIRRDDPNVRILVLSGVTRRQAEPLARKLGADAYLEKPAGLDRIVTTLRTLGTAAARPTVPAGTQPVGEGAGGPPAAPLVHPDTPPGEAAVLAEAIEEGYVRNDLTDLPRHDEDAAGVRWTTHDLRVAAEHSPIGLALVGLDGSWLRVNEALCRLTGRSEPELLQLTFQDITHPDDLESDLSNVRRLLHGEDDSYEMEKRYIHADGSEVPILLTVSLVRDPVGAPQYFVAQIQDISQRKRAEEQLDRTLAELERSNLELQRFAALVSHDLRSPLAVVQGTVELLSDGAGGRDFAPDLQQDLLSRARRQVDKALSILEALRSLASVQSEPLSRVPVDLGEMLATVVETLAPGSDVTIEDGGLPVVDGDRKTLGVLLQNLVQNALKYRHPGRPVVVRVTAERYARDWIITVADNGPGVPRELQERIFEPFVRAPDAHDISGTGIGLATCAAIVERHDGRIWVEDAPEGGACFRFSLPVPFT
jgi:PAS domain S-box-containing protein